MNRPLLIWMAFAQAMHLLSLLPWLQMVQFVRVAFANHNGPQILWPTVAVGLTILYPLILIVLSIAAWRTFYKEEFEAAGLLLSVPLFLSLPMVILGFVTLVSMR